MAIRSNEEVVVDLLARYDKLERALSQAGRTVDQRLSGMEQRGSAFASRFTGLLAGISAGAVIGELAKLADETKKLDAQLRLATNGFGTFAQGQADVQRISENTRGSLEATTKLYAGFLRASRETGRSQTDAARATETFAEALKIGGASTEEAASATLQFNQALQSGVLRGDEFNSVMEASPRVARLLADALGVPIGQLRQMAEQGQITSDVLFRALTDRKFTAGIDAEFKQIPVTFGDAMQAIENAALTSFGEFDQGGRFSETLVTFLGTGTHTFEALTSKAQQFGIDTRAVFDGLGNVFDPMLANGNSVFDALGIRIFSVRDQIASLLDSIDSFANFDANIENTVKRGLNRAIDRAGGGQHFEESRLSNLGGSFRAGARVSAAQSRRDAAARRLEGLGYTVPRNADGSINEAGIVRRPQVPAVATSSSAAARPARSGLRTSSGKSDAEREAEQATKEYRSFIADLKKDLLAVRDPEGFVGSEQLGKASRHFQGVFGREGQDYADPFAGVADYDKQRDLYFRAAADAESDAQDLRERNVYDLANSFEVLFQRGTDGIWRDFKNKALSTLAFVAAQAAVASFSKGGGGFGSLLSNIGKAASSAFSGTGGLPRLANGGSIAAGGLGGVDRNVLSVNGVPRAMISANERLSVSNPNIAGANIAAAQRGPGNVTVVQHFHADMRGAMTFPEFVKSFKGYVDNQANNAGAAAVSTSLKMMPGTLSQSQKLRG